MDRETRAITREGKQGAAVVGATEVRGAVKTPVRGENHAFRGTRSVAVTEHFQNAESGSIEVQREHGPLAEEDSIRLILAVDLGRAIDDPGVVLDQVRGRILSVEAIEPMQHLEPGAVAFHGEERTWVRIRQWTREARAKKAAV